MFNVQAGPDISESYCMKCILCFFVVSDGMRKPNMKASLCVLKKLKYAVFLISYKLYSDFL